MSEQTPEKSSREVTMQAIGDLVGVNIDDVIDRSTKTAVKHGLFMLGQILKMLGDISAGIHVLNTQIANMNPNAVDNLQRVGSLVIPRQ